MVLARRLEGQMGEITSANAEASRSSSGGDGKAEEKRERAMAEAALTLAEIGSSSLFSFAFPSLTRISCRNASERERGCRTSG